METPQSDEVIRHISTKKFEALHHSMDVLELAIRVGDTDVPRAIALALIGDMQCLIEVCDEVDARRED